jgi:regulator of PEP synthase PpsR (kinase-PPPase family)
VISDSTGETLITVARAAAAQYAKTMPVEHVHPLVRTQKQLDHAGKRLPVPPMPAESIWA